MRDFQEHFFSGSLMNIAGWIIALLSVLASFAVSRSLSSKPSRSKIAEPDGKKELSDSEINSWLKEARIKYADEKLTEPRNR
jgi:hypothetical protein